MVVERFEGSGQSCLTGGAFNLAVEEIREQVLELVMNNEQVIDLVHDEVSARFPKGVPSDGHGNETLDEVVCMCQLLVYDRVLKGIIR